MTKTPARHSASDWHGERVTLDVRNSTVLRILLVGTLFFAGVNLAVELSSFFLTLAVAAFLAIAADPLVRLLEGRGLRRGPAVGVLLLGIVTALGLMAAILVPPLIDQGDRLVVAAPQLVDDLQHNPVLRDLDRRFDLLDKLQVQAAKVPARVSDSLGSLVSAVIAGVAGTITVLFLMVLLLLGGHNLVYGTARVFPQMAERRWWMIVQGAYRSISAYVAGSLLIALCAGIAMTITLLALGLPYPLPLGLWMLLLDIIPLVGATIGAVPAIIVAFAAGGTVQGIVMLAFVVVYQQLENSVIQPRIQGRAAALPTLIIFMAVLIGSQILGIIGALFAVPFAGVMSILYQQYIAGSGGEHVELPPLAPDIAPEPPHIGHDGGATNGD